MSSRAPVTLKFFDSKPASQVSAIVHAFDKTNEISLALLVVAVAFAVECQQGAIAGIEMDLRGSNQSVRYQGLPLRTSFRRRDHFFEAKPHEFSCGATSVCFVAVYIIYLEANDPYSVEIKNMGERTM